MNLTELLDATARRWPRKPALIEGSTVIFYESLIERISAASAQLKAVQVRPGSRIGLHCPNNSDYVAWTFALWRLNAVVVPIPIECVSSEVSAITETMQLEALLSHQPQPGGVPLASGGCFTKLHPRRPPDNHELNIAFIRFTSGTTNARKGVVLCHETIRYRIFAANKALRIGPDDTVMWCLPMSHHFLCTILLYLSQGATIVLARHVLAQSFIEAVNDWQGTVLYASPFHYGLLAGDTTSAKLPSVRLAVSTTSALSQEVSEDFFKRFGRPLSPALGIIEAGLVTLNINDPVGRWNSVGQLLEDYRLRLIAPDENGCGEVALSGPGLLDAYAAPWLPREKVLHDGWFHTGDIGYLDKDGFLFLVGRKTAVINLAGRKMFPEEIESVLNRHPAVRESLVYGRAHPHLGEVIEADVVLANPESDLDTVRDFCRANLAPFKIPSRLNVVNALPRTAATGKLRRAAA